MSDKRNNEEHILRENREEIDLDSDDDVSIISSDIGSDNSSVGSDNSSVASESSLITQVPDNRGVEEGALRPPRAIHRLSVATQGLPAGGRLRSVAERLRILGLADSLDDNEFVDVVRQSQEIQTNNANGQQLQENRMRDDIGTMELRLREIHNMEFRARIESQHDIMEIRRSNAFDEDDSSVESNNRNTLPNRPRGGGNGR